MKSKKKKITDENLNDDSEFDFLWELKVPFEQLANTRCMAEIISLEAVYYGRTKKFFIWYVRGKMPEMRDLIFVCRRTGVIIKNVSDDIELQAKYSRSTVQWKRGL